LSAKVSIASGQASAKAACFANPSICEGAGFGGDYGMEIENKTELLTQESHARRFTAREATAWQRWLQHPERSRVRKVLFQIHLWVGAGAGMYVVLMSVTGSIIVFRDGLSKWFSVEWLVKFHENLASGDTGRVVNGIGAICVTMVCLTGAIIWWPGLKNWRRSLTVSWGSRFARFNWDIHSALGFWCFLFVLMWGVSGIYFSFPDSFNAVSAFLDPRDNYGDKILSGLALLHFGRFAWYTEVLWAVLGLVPAFLAFTGVFLCCHRMIYRRSANPNG
jgi:uncharacterized iron-regulated membrane protein